MSYLTSLNEQQYEAVTAPLGPVRVLAGAGSGKTRVLTSRIAWLLSSGQSAPYSILAVTFTNKAAFEMRVRLEDQLTLPIQGMWIGTFHSLCHRLLRLHHQQAGLIQNFQIMDSDDQTRLCRRIIRAKGLDEKNYIPKMLASFINAHKDEGRRAQHIDAYNDSFTQNLVELYKEYQAVCEQSGLVDFSEILLRSLELLRNNQALLTHYQERFKFILVDEFQDTNSVQYAWLKLLADKHQQLFVVGDDDQSIYGWRGAKVENILNFDIDFEGVTTVRLEQNYRSTKAILSAANHVIAKNQERLAKELWTENDSEQPIIVYRAMEGYDEARFVVETIKETLSKGSKRLSDIAILYRSNAQSRVFEEFLLKNQIPYRVYGGFRFFDRAEIKDIMAYLRLVINPSDDVSLERTITMPPKGIGQTTIENIREFARMHQLSLWNAIETMLESQALKTRVHNALLNFVEIIYSLQRKLSEAPALKDFFQYAIEASGLKPHYKKEPMNRGEDRIDNLDELVTAAEYFSTNDHVESVFSEEPRDIISLSVTEQLEIFLRQTTLDSSEGQAEEDENSIQLMTLHSSKGLEFAHVFLVGMEDGLFPSENSSQDERRLEEERRLAYVGITRAKEQLYISSAEHRMIYGRTLYLPISRFVRDIPLSLIHTIGPSMKVVPTLKQQRSISSKIGQQSSYEGYKLGQLVSHPKFGEGVILGFEGSGASTRVNIQFANEGIKMLVLSYARLTTL